MLRKSRCTVLERTGCGCWLPWLLWAGVDYNVHEMTLVLPCSVHAAMLSTTRLDSKERTHLHSPRQSGYSPR